MYFTVPDAANGFKFDGNANNNTTISGNGNITTAGSIAAASLQTSSNCTVGGSLTVTGSLTTTSFYAAKPWVANYVIGNALSTLVKPGFSQTGVSVSRSSAGVYVFTIPAHPQGANYIVFIQGGGPDSTYVAPLYHVIVASSTSFTVWSKTTSTSVLADSNFYVYTLP